MLLQLGVSCDCLAQSKANEHGSQYYGGRVHSCLCSQWRSCMASEDVSGLFDLQGEATCIYCDNQSCIKLSENPVFHDKSKHIEIKYQYIRDMVEKGAVKLQYIATDEQIADVLTKPLSRVKLEYFRDKLGVVPRKRE